jgi:hypothetical protein
MSVADEDVLSRYPTVSSYQIISVDVLQFNELLIFDSIKTHRINEHTTRSNSCGRYRTYIHQYHNAIDYLQVSDV